MKTLNRIVYVTLFIISVCVITSAQADIAKDKIPSFLYIQNINQGSLEVTNKNNAEEMILTAQLAKGETISFTNSKDIKLGGVISNEKFVEVFNEASKGRSLNSALVISLPNTTSSYYILGINTASYDPKTQEITYHAKVVQSTGVAKNNQGKITFNHAVLFIDDVCLTCAL